jgi:hypothetical protein
VTLDDEMRAVILQMRLLGGGKTQSFNSSGGKSENPDPRPSGEPSPMADHWVAEWAREPSERTLEAARAELRAWKKREAPAQDDGTDFEQWVIDDGQGYAVEQVASKFGIAAQRVVRLRLKHKRDAEFGMPTEATTRVQRQDKSRERVLNLASQGMTLRQIEAITDVKRETARRWLKEVA